MIIDSPLTPGAYRRAMCNKLDNFHNLWDERFSGGFIGPTFVITHHCYTEWNRKITGEMNNAIGFLKKTDAGCRVYFIHTTGFLTPLRLITTFFLVFFLSLFYDFPKDSEWVTLLLSGVITVVCVLFSAITNALTTNGIRGGDTLYELMCDPTFGQGE